MRDNTPSRDSRPLPYVGVSGVVSPTQQAELSAIATTVGLPAERRLLLGVKATHKTLLGGAGDGVENKYGHEWYPVGRMLVDAIDPTVDPARQWPVAQVYLDVDHVSDDGYRAAFMDRLLGHGSGWLAGVQFDMLPWHDNADMEPFLHGLRETTGLPVLLQCHGPAMDLLGPEGAARRLGELANVIDFVLFDSSHGTGKRLDVDRLTSFVDAAYSCAGLDEIGVAVAGGLSPATVTEDLPALVARFPDLSWDAEGSLHLTNTDGVRPLDMDVVHGYLSASAQLLA
jgi:hypothetical protein